MLENGVVRSPTQRWLTVIFWSVLGLISTGGLLDAFANSLSLKPYTLWLAALVVVSWAILEIALKCRGIDWSFGQTQGLHTIRGLGAKYRAALIGSLGLLLLPHALDRFGTVASYAIMDLGRPDERSFAYGVSDVGAVAGHRVLPSGHRAFYSADAIHDVDIVADADKKGFINSSVAKMSSKGDIVGTTSGNGPTFPFTWSPTRGFRLFDFPSYMGVSINAAGYTLINSSSYPAGGRPQPLVLLPNGHVLRIVPPTGFPNCSMNVTDINDHGTVVGYCLQDSIRPVIVQAFVADAYGTRLLTAPNALSTVARAINNSGLIVGSGGPSIGVGRVVVWGATGPRYLSVPEPEPSGGSLLNCDALDVNDDGIVVGTCTPMSLGGSAVITPLMHRATVWIAENGYLLDNLIAGRSGWRLTEATGINRFGQIVGHGHIQNEIHAYRLDPRPPSAISASPPGTH